MEQNGEEFSFRSTITGPGNGVIDFKLKYKVKCNIPGEFKINIDKCLSHEKISSRGEMQAYIQGSECFLIKDAQLFEDEVIVSISPTYKPECNQMIDTEFFVNLRTDFRGVLEMSSKCLVKSEEYDSKVGCVHYIINSSAIKNLGCPKNFPIIVGFKSYQEMRVIDVIKFEISEQINTQENTFCNIQNGSYYTLAELNWVMCNGKSIVKFISSESHPFEINGGLTTLVNMSLEEIKQP